MLVISFLWKWNLLICDHKYMKEKPWLLSQASFEQKKVLTIEQNTIQNILQSI